MSGVRVPHRPSFNVLLNAHLREPASGSAALCVPTTGSHYPHFILGIEMMQREEKTMRFPGYRKLGAGQAFVRLNGKNIYLGKHGTPET